MPANREDIEFQTRDQTTLRGWFYPAAGEGDKPCVIATAGLSQGIEHNLAPWAEGFNDAGFSVLLYDHRNWYKSDGEPRLETNPWIQMQDIRDAVSFVSQHPGIDRERIGLWGTSYGGGMSIIAAAVDRRVKCVVANVPMIAGSDVTYRWSAGDTDSVGQEWAKSRDAEARGEGVQYAVWEVGGGEFFKETRAWLDKVDPDDIWENKMSVATGDMMNEVDPIDWVHKVAPTPLMMLVTDRDMTASISKQLETYERARSPKRLVILRGRHYITYVELLEPALKETVRFLTEHLLEIPPVVVCDG